MESMIQPKAEKILLNAEAFGFGPSAAVATIFPHLREKFERIGFVGSGLSLDIQRKLPYDEIHDLTGLDGSDQDKEIAKLAKEYGVVFSAMDFPLLEKCKQAGARTCGYDALTWYWPSLHTAGVSTDLYLAQNFFGVEARLHRESHLFNQSAVVPAIVHSHRSSSMRSLVMINLGGLQNPRWSLDESVHYARKISQAIKQTLPTESEVLLATSEEIARRIGAGARTFSREEMLEFLARTKYAFMTPGLGNIYDAAQFDIPTVWLPPANDSQGRQLSLLRTNGLTDEAMEWNDFKLPNPIDFNLPQDQVMRDLAAVVASVPLRDLSQALLSPAARIRQAPRSVLPGLLERFGADGDREVARKLIEFGSNLWGH